MLTNTCKLPYTFLTNDDVIDGDDNFRNECPSRELNDHIVLSLTEGVLTLTGEVKQEMGSTKFFDPIKLVGTNNYENNK
uniref:Uncharacterized protein n=1 Tax=Caenorhabditis japonica TaxID=281687 RepID=A0A8R1EI59_CAEJA